MALPTAQNIGGGDGGHPVENVVRRTGIGAGDNRPLRPIPMLNKRLILISIIAAVTYRPDIGSGDSRDSSQKRPGPYHGAGNNRPLRPIPMLDEGLVRGTGTYRPDIGGRDRGNST